MMAQFRNFTLPVRQSVLLTALRENRERHLAAWSKAHAVWFKKALAQAKENVRIAEEDGELELVISLKRPINYTKEYDQVISMLEMVADPDEPINLTAEQHRCWVMDDGWDWKEDFLTTNKHYGISR